MMLMPVDDHVVLDPESLLPLHKDGEDKPKNEYWLRRLADGVVVECMACESIETDDVL